LVKEYKFDASGEAEMTEHIEENCTMALISV
jgi:hypothetical protein